MNFFIYIVTYRNQLEVAPLKNLSFLDVLELDVKDYFKKKKKKKNKRMRKNLPYNINLLYINIG